MTINTLADIVGASSGAVTGANLPPVKWIAFSCTGTGAARVGDSNTAAARGQAVTAGQTVIWPPDTSAPFNGYSLALVYAYVPSGATLSITYGVF